MHNTDLDLSLEEITKIEGAATLDLKIRAGVVKECKFIISEFKRFYTQAIRGKPVAAVPQLVARICGTCSNAHLICNLVALERALGLTPSAQTQLLRELLNYGLIIRDHGLHLYVFALPDLFGRSSILEFDENSPAEHQLLDDCFSVKAVGNNLGKIVGGRSVHAPYPTIGGFTQLPDKNELLALIPKLENIRPKILHLIEVFRNCPFSLIQDGEFVALVDDKYSFLDGKIKNRQGEIVDQRDFGAHLEQSVIPYSQALGIRFDGKIHLVGALARLNLNKDALHSQTKKDAAAALAHFPSINIFHNNLAQAIEMLQAVDRSLDLIKEYQALPETPPTLTPKTGMGVGVIEAPRGTLFHQMELTDDGKIKTGRIVVPTGQNQIGIERSIFEYVSQNTDQPKETLTHEIEKIIRAYDPCMSCATHFLKVNWR